MTILEYYRIQNYIWGKKDWNNWEKRVRKLESEGVTRSDAQGIVDIKYMRGEYL